MLMKKFNSEKLKVLLDEKNISQVTIADKLSISPSTVSNWVKGKTIPDINNLNNLSEMLDVSVDELMDEANQNTFNGTNSANYANIYNSHVIINPSESKSDFTFIDNKNENTLTIAVALEKELISKIVSNAIQNNMLPGKYLNDLIEKNSK